MDSFDEDVQVEVLDVIIVSSSILDEHQSKVGTFCYKNGIWSFSLPRFSSPQEEEEENKISSYDSNEVYLNNISSEDSSYTKEIPVVHEDESIICSHGYNNFLCYECGISICYHPSLKSNYYCYDCGKGCCVHKRGKYHCGDCNRGLLGIKNQSKTGYIPKIRVFMEK